MVVFGLPPSRVGSLYRARTVERTVYSSGTRPQTEWPIHRLSTTCPLAARYLVPMGLGRGVSDSHDGLAIRTALLRDSSYAHAVVQTF